MSLFRFAKYSALLFFLGKYKTRLFRVVAVLLFAGVTSLLYQDVAEYLQREHPGTVIYALFGKIIIVYGALAFVLWQFRPEPGDKSPAAGSAKPQAESIEPVPAAPADRLAQLEDLGEHDRLATRYENILASKRETKV
jgi:hypothetical protein